MPYLTVRVSSVARGVIYEKDYPPDIVFGKFVRLQASQLVGLDLLKEGDEYWAGITPGTDERERLEELSWQALTAPTPHPGKGWLVLRADGMTGSAPMRYFILELHQTSGGTNSYRKSFPLSELEYRTNQEKQTLAQLGAITPDEEVDVEYFPVAGNKIRERELLHMPEALASLGVGLLVEAVDEADVPEKQMPECNCGHGGQVRGKTLEVFFEGRGFSRLRHYVAEHATRAMETGGILIGEVYRQPRGGQLYIEVEDFIPAEKTEANAVSLRFTHETWQWLMERKQERFSERKPVVGWYHTHPPIPTNIRGQVVETVAFFSRDDEIVQKQFFREQWQIALVMDGGSEEFAVFRWQESTIVESESHFFDMEKQLYPHRKTLDV